MAETFAELAMEGVPMVTDNYEKVYDPIKDKTKQGINKVRSVRNGQNGARRSEDEGDEYDRYGPPRRSQTDRRRRSPRDDYRDDNRRPSRSRRGDVVEERYTYSKSNGRARSVGGNRQKGRRRDYSDSESSLSPPRRERRKSLGEKALVALGLGGVAGAEADKGRRRSRERRRRSRTRSRRRGSTPSSDSGGYYVPKSNRSRGPPANGGGHYDDRTPDRYKPAGYIRDRDDRDSERGNDRGQEVARRNNQSFVGARSNGAIDEPRGKKRDSSSSESSSEVCSSSEDDRRTKKMKGKEFLTAGLAAVATIHAAHGVYSSMEARDQRQMEVLKGELSPEEARKTKHKAWLQDAAAIGIAALGIKGAYSEWQEVQGHRHELAEEQSERKKRHEKRVRKAEKYQKGGSQYGRSRSEGPGRRDRDYSR